MPIFEYRCVKCGKAFEKLVRSQSEKVLCPSCLSTVERQLSVFAAPPSSQASKCASGDSCPTAGTKCCASGRCGLHR